MDTLSKENLLYFLDNKPYINMTNACTNSCVFCVRNQKEDVQGAKLWLDKDNTTSSDVITQIEENIKKVLTAGEIVFCGYGEPLIKINEVIEICKYLKEKYPSLKIRINTNGHANAIHKRNVAPELAPYIDIISISLNAENEEKYNLVSKPKIDNAYEEVKRFIRACVEEKIYTIASIVDKVPNYPVNKERCEVIAKSLGAKFRSRDFIENGY
ncbi:MAG: TatD family nuclease-associated radical SAM protein [Candidatus Gastranaerophilales bacterium]|nr:TatD family nuclease-associated radical SAM protein [Candidatus Gastranaerophilales bacterium]